MIKFSIYLASLISLLPAIEAVPSSKPLLSSSHLLSIRTASPEVSHGLSNIHLDWSFFARSTTQSQQLSLSYGNCDDPSISTSHHVVGTTDLSSHQELPARFVWQIGEQTPTGGCISAWAGDDLIGRSQSLDVVPNARNENRKRQLGKRDVKMSDFDTTGLWFDGAGEYTIYRKSHEYFSNFNFFFFKL